ncbi:hypothetical protein PICMEDRAFT_122889 [Pichia membranifaciens NRRL Y-2026]|uniref:Secreted protein n=1 Tax=Pichia membranifaciens NRRL Y-2026 TaxID=763406 RepID=A0A1E3NPP3_9ASCO|nr:hypothetical protein PICMEDRAFT_122889 [Pichia membranifaciens NRRL Y-2026]ODQ48069.1 hypothetical protein PICMEDRAFT_122889 [Pichia membranifaciens NRRL Y-2026]
MGSCVAARLCWGTLHVPRVLGLGPGSYMAGNGPGKNKACGAANPSTRKHTDCLQQTNKQTSRKKKQRNTLSSSRRMH